MSIKRTIITTLVALTLVAVVAPVTVSATTVEDLQAQIAALTAQLSSLSGTTTTSNGNVPANCVGITFSRNLTIGSTGSDVKCLQELLNTSSTTQIASTGAGSPGYETSYFGAKTLVAVKKYQAEQGFTPANQVGPMTRAALNEWLNSGTTGTTETPTTGNYPEGCTSSSGYSSTTGVSCATGAAVVVIPSGSITATLASDSPAAGALINSQATAGLLNINFAGTGTVTSVTLQRSGISNQNTLANIYLFDGNTRITDGYSFNVNGTTTINGLNIAVNGTKTISVKADVSSTATTDSSSIAVALTSFTGNSQVTSASVQGATQTIVTGSAATVYLATNAYASNTPTVNAGTTQYTFWTDSVQVNTRAVLLKTANFRMIGSAPSDALSNIKLFVDGTDTGKVATIGSITGSNYAMFDLTSAPISLLTGSHTIDVRADIQKGTNRTVQFSVQQASDLTVYDPQVGVNIAVLGNGGDAFTSNAGATVTINYGTATVTIDPTFTSQTNITSGATNAVIGKFVIHAYGEDVKVSSLQVTPLIESATSTGATCTTAADGTGATTGGCGLNNVTLYFNGSQIGSSHNWTAAEMTAATTISYTLGSQMIATAGQDSTIEIRADLQTANSVAYTGGTVKVSLVGDTDNAYGQSSQYTVGVPTATQTTTGLAISTATVVVSKSSAYGSQSVGPNTPGVRIGSYVVQNQSTSESVRLTTLTVALVSTGTTDLTSTELTGLSALRTSDITGSGSTPIQPSASNTFSVNDTLAPGASMTIDIYANTGSATILPQVITRLKVASIGVTSNISSAGTMTSGQTMTLSTGTVATPTLVVSSTTPAQYIAAAGGATSASQATFSFISTSGASKINELKFTVSGSDADPSQTVTSVCVGTVCAQPVAGVADLTGLALDVPTGGGLIQNVQVSYAPVGTGGIIPGMGSTLSLTYVKYTSGGTTGTLSPSVAAPMITLVGSKPTLAVSTGGSTGMVLNASTKVGQVTVTADPKGAVKVSQITFTLGYTGYGTAPDTALTAASISLGGTSTAISGSSCTTDNKASVVCTLGSSYANDFLIAAGQSQQFDLYITTANAVASATLKAVITSSVSASGFKWDDTSANGVNSEGVALTGTLIYGFPTGAYSVGQ